MSQASTQEQHIPTTTAPQGSQKPTPVIFDDWAAL